MAKAPPISVRIPVDVLERLDAEASPTLTRNAIIISALRLRYQMDAKPRAGSTSPARPKTVLPHMGKDGMQVGAVRPKAGALLDKKSRQKWRL